MERRPDIGLGSYDRLFPNQDTLPKGGLGNLIALPLQRRSRESGNSVFLDESFAPYPDQWAFLSTIRKIGRPVVETIVRDAEAKDRVVGVRHALAEKEELAPWAMPPSRRRKEPPLAGPLPAELQLVVSDDIIQTARQGRSPIVLTERNEHLDRLAALLAPAVNHVIVLRGGMGGRQLRATAARLGEVPGDQERVLVATGRYIGEGFDDARLDTLFLTLPVSWRGTIAQYVGRLHRLYDRKREVQVYDYADLDVPVLARMFDRRCRGYEAVGYRIVVLASAVPGWPVDVPLPAEPEWKRDYAAASNG